MDITFEQYIKMVNEICALKTRVSVYEKMLKETQDIIIAQNEPEAFKGILEATKLNGIKGAYVWGGKIC